MKYLPIGLDVRSKKCLVVGGGTVGERKIANLLRAGATVSVVAPSVSEKVSKLASSEQVRWIEELYQAVHLNDMFLVVAATDDEKLNESIVADANERAMLVCDASSADRSQVIFGALHRSDKGITLAVFTDGRDPTLARQTRDRLANTIDDSANSKSLSDNS